MRRVPIHRDGVGSLSLGSGEPATEPTVAGETSICAAEANASPETYAGVDPNGDGKVDGADLAFWQRHYDPLGANDNTWFHGDWNLDGRVDGGDLALWQRGYDPVGSPVVGEYPWFNGFCREYFGAEKEELVYETFGSDASFDATGEWQHVSVQSAVFAFETTLPTVTTVNFGETSDYGYMTTPSERPFYLHQHTLRDILPETTYHYRFVAMDERGNVIVGEDRTFTTGSLLEVISISVTHLSVPYALDRAGAIYVLVNDVTADSTAFNIMAGNVTFDLNGHTVTYDQVGGAYDPTATLSYFPNWMIAGPHGVRTGWSADGSRVLNGTIIQGAGSNGEGANPVVADDLADFAGMTVIYHGSQVTGLYGDAGHVHHNVIVDEGTEITDRHNGIKAIQAAGAPVHHNLIKRCRQNGIKVYDNDDVYKNEVYVDSWATNSYAIMCYTHGNSVIHDNWIFGGGYNVVGIGTLGTGARDIEVYDNFVHLQATEPTDRWPEYGAISGVRGMRITWFADNVTYHDNVFAVYACDGGTVRGLWYCPATDVTNVLFIHNTVKAVAQNVASNQSGAIVINGWSPTNAAAGIFRENRVISNFCNVCIGDSYGGGTNAVFIGNTFVRIGDRANYRTIEIGDDWQVCSGHRFIDSLFEGGAGYDHVLFESGNTRNFTVEWTLTVNTSPHSNVTIRDRDDATVFSGSSGVTGSVSVVLVQYRQEPTGRIVATPHTVTVEKDGRTASAPVTMDRKRPLTLYPPTALTMPLELLPLAGAEALIVE